MNGAKSEIPEGFVPGNHFDKYRSQNLIHRVLVGAFVRSALELVHIASPIRVLEVGCGPGDLAEQLFDSKVCYIGLDISPDAIDTARQRYPDRSFMVGSAYKLPYMDKSFDLVVLCEVLEHLEHPEMAIKEAARVSASHVLVSVPWEPIWRLLNVVRGKYWSRKGNTPGHIQHFSRKRLRLLIDKSFTRIAERSPFPWTMILGRMQPTSSNNFQGDFE